MRLSPAIRGLAGIEGDALNRTLTINPQLPAEWTEASLANVAVGDRRFNIHLRRMGRKLEIDVVSGAPEVLCLTRTAATEPCGCRAPAPPHK